MPDKKLPGTPISSSEMKSLTGVWLEKEMPSYIHSAGSILSHFLKGLKDGVILGGLCPSCGRILVPPRGYCEYCYRPVAKLVRLSGKGMVYSAVISYISADRKRMEKPLIMGVVELEAPGEKHEGWFPGLYHRLCGFSIEDVMNGSIIGAKVKAKWKPKEEREGSLRDIECFEKEEV